MKVGFWYMDSGDPFVEWRRAKTHLRCQILLLKFSRLPFWLRWIKGRTGLQREITREWLAFERWRQEYVAVKVLAAAGPRGRKDVGGYMAGESMSKEG